MQCCCNFNDSENVINLVQLDYYHKKFDKISDALSSHFAQSGVRLGVGGEALDGNDALVDAGLKAPQVLDVEQPEDLECVAQGRVGRPQLGRDAHAVLGEVHGLALRLRRLVGLGREDGTRFTTLNRVHWSPLIRSAVLSID